VISHKWKRDGIVCGSREYVLLSLDIASKLFFVNSLGIRPDAGFILLGMHLPYTQRRTTVYGSLRCIVRYSSTYRVKSVFTTLAPSTSFPQPLPPTSRAPLLQPQSLAPSTPSPASQYTSHSYPPRHSHSPPPSSPV